MLNFYNLPVEAQTRLKEEVDSSFFNPDKHTIEVVEDPNVYGTYAIRVVETNVYLIWYHYEEWEECEFEQWPPTIGSLQY